MEKKKQINDTPRVLTRSQSAKIKACTARRRPPPSVIKFATRLYNFDYAIETRQRKLACMTNLLSLPREIHLMILGYLGSQDLHTVRQVSVYFEELVRDPTLWKEYEIMDNKLDTKSVISDLKRMPFLKKISINNRTDCDQILKQVAISNKNLEQLSVNNCTGTTANLHLGAGNLTKIAKRCRRLHTVRLVGSRFRGVKLFRMLGEAGPRLRNLTATTTCDQFRTFARHAKYVSEKDRELLSSLPRNRLSRLQYQTIATAAVKNDDKDILSNPDILVTYRDNRLGQDFELMLRSSVFENTDKTTTTTNPMFSSSVTKYQSSGS